MLGNGQILLRPNAKAREERGNDSGIDARDVFAFGVVYPSSKVDQARERFDYHDEI